VTEPPGSGAFDPFAALRCAIGAECSGRFAQPLAAGSFFSPSIGGSQPRTVTGYVVSAAKDALAGGHRHMWGSAVSFARLALGSARSYDLQAGADLDTRIQQLHIVIELCIAR